MITQTIAAAHDAGYLRGLVIGGTAFGVLGVIFGFFIAAILQASAVEPPATSKAASEDPRVVKYAYCLECRRAHGHLHKPECNAVGVRSRA